MKITIFGGTAKLGKALTSRIHNSGHAVSVGSRDRVKAAEVAKEVGPDVLADTNEAAASRAHDNALAFDQQGKQS